jgi:hypothetical protein
MKERILRVLMFFAVLFAIGFTVLIAVVETRSTLIAAGIGIGVIGLVSALQYIIIGEWHPIYLFEKKKE